MGSRFAIIAIIAILVLVILGCGNGGSPAASPTVALTYEKDEAKPTVAGRPRPTGPATPTPKPPPQLLAFDFIDADHGWLAFGSPDWQEPPDNAMIFMSSDAGRTWTSIYETNIHISAIDYTSLAHGWFSTESSLFTTTDGGKSWSETTELGAPEKITDMHFVDESHGWIVSTTQLLASTDSGDSWVSRANPCPGRAVHGPSISFTDSVSGWAICGGVPGAGNQLKQLYSTVDGGQSWELVAASQFRDQTPIAPGNIPTYGYVNGLAFADHLHGWLATSRGGLYGSQDGGLSWGSMPTALYCGDWFNAQPQLLTPDTGYIIDNCGARTILVGTRDGGVTWSRLYPSPFLDSCSIPETRLRINKSDC